MNALSNSAPASPPVTAGEAASDALNLEFTRNMGQISRQSIMFFAGTLFTLGAGYLVKIYVARVLGAENLGLYALGMTLASLIQLIGIVGLHSTAARYVAVYNATGKYDELRGFLARSTGIVVVLNLVFSVVLLFAGRWIATTLYHAPDLGQYIPYFAALAFLGSLNVFYCQVLGGFKDVARRTVITNFIGSTLVIALVVLFLALGTGMRGYLAAQIINSVVVVALLVEVARRLTPRPARFSLSSLRRTSLRPASLRPALLPPFDPEIKAFAAAAFGMNILDFLVSQADKILLGFFLNPSLVGIYVVASTLTAFIPIILQSVNQIFSPLIAHLHAQHRQDVLEKLFQTLTKWVLGLTLPLAFVVIAFALPLMRIFGPGFVAGWPVLVIGAVGQIVNCGVGSVGYLLLMSGNQRRLIRVQFVMAGVSILVNIVLIPILGIVGAALASATVNVAGNVWNLYHVRKALRISPYNRGYYGLLIPAVFSAACAAGLRLWTSRMAFSWPFILLALVLSYLVFGGFALACALDPDDRMIARSAWSYLRGAIQSIGAKG